MPVIWVTPARVLLQITVEISGKNHFQVFLPLFAFSRVEERGKQGLAITYVHLANTFSIDAQKRAKLLPKVGDVSENASSSVIALYVQLFAENRANGHPITLSLMNGDG